MQPTYLEELFIQQQLGETALIIFTVFSGHYQKYQQFEPIFFIEVYGIQQNKTNFVNSNKGQTKL